MRHRNLLKFSPGLILACCLTAASGSDPALPDASVVVAGMLQRSAEVANAEPSQVWAYDKRSVTEQLDDDGQVTSTTEKLHRVKLYRGVPFSRLVSVRGQALSSAELRKEEKREAAFRNRISGREPDQVASRKEALIPKDLVDRYQFEVRKREMIDGRSTLQLAFSIKPGKQVEKTLPDRILNRLAGTVWVDEATFEVTRLNVGLTQGFSLGLLGILGSLSECRFNLIRQPMPDGTWLPLTEEAHITARKLASSVHFRVKQQSDNFQAEPASGS